MTAENQAPEGAPHHCAPHDIAALVARLEALADPEQEAMPSFADTDWRTLSSVCHRVISHLATPAPQAAPAELPDIDLCRLISTHEVYQYHPGALHEFAHEVIAEFCRANDIPAPQTKEPTNDR